MNLASIAVNIYALYLTIIRWWLKGVQLTHLWPSVWLGLFLSVLRYPFNISLVMVCPFVCRRYDDLCRHYDVVSPLSRFCLLCHLSSWVGLPATRARPGCSPVWPREPLKSGSAGGGKESCSPTAPELKSTTMRQPRWDSFFASFTRNCEYCCNVVTAW